MDIIKFYCVLVGGVISSSAMGKGFEFDLSSQNIITQNDYDSLASAVSKPLAYSWMSPASPTGITGFDIGVGGSFTRTPGRARELSKAYMKNQNELPDWIGFPKITLQKGLPVNLDVGANVGFIPGTQWKLLGLGLQWTFLDGTSPLPSVALRAGYATLVGDKALATQQTTVEAVASVKIPPVVNIIEPFGAIGFNNRSITSDIDAISKFYSFSEQDWHVSLGARLSLLPLIGVVAEVQWAQETIFHGRISVRL